MNEKDSLIASEDARKPMNAVIKNPDRSRNAPPVAQTRMEELVVTGGLQETASVTPLVPKRTRDDLEREDAQMPDANGGVEDSAAALASVAAASSPSSSLPTLSASAQSRSGAPPTKKAKPRASRKCSRCGRDDCPGRGGKGVAACTNPCRDCDKPTCKGRDTKKTGKAGLTCMNSWD